MYDMHSHICFGIDDGSADKNMSEAMLKLASRKGTTTICATPHVIELGDKPSWETICSQVEELHSFSKEQGLELEVYPGAEVFMNPDLLPELGVHGSYCINGGQYILVELPMHQLPQYADDFWYELRLKGLTPILAHPERYRGLMENKPLLEKWRNEGLVLQCNLGSFAGYFGKGAKHNAEFLIQQHMVDLVGSDGHRDVEPRDTNLCRGLAELQQLAGPEEVERILCINPQKILQSEALELKKVKLTEEKKKGFWSKLFG